MALLAAGCGGSGKNTDPAFDAMWSSSGGVLSCVGATPYDVTDTDLKACEWTCTSIDGREYQDVVLAFAMDGSEWRLTSRYWKTGVCP